MDVHVLINALSRKKIPLLSVWISSSLLQGSRVGRAPVLNQSLRNSSMVSRLEGVSRKSPSLNIAKKCMKTRFIVSENLISDLASS